MKKTLRTLRARVDRVMRDVERQAGQAGAAVMRRCWNWLLARSAYVSVVPANVSMDRLAARFPEAYASHAQLRTLQRRVKAWQAERVKELSPGGLQKSTDAPVEV